MDACLGNSVVATKLKCPMLRKVEMSHQAQTVARLCSPETLNIEGRRSLAAVMVKVGCEPNVTDAAPCANVCFLHTVALALSIIDQASKIGDQVGGRQEGEVQCLDVM